MFKNIKKQSEFSLMNEKLAYEQSTMLSPELHGGAPEVEPDSPEKARAALMEDMDTLVFARESQILKLLSSTDAYKNGDWRELTERFKKEFEGFGVHESSAERLLKKFQKEAFDSLGLTGDRLAVADAKLGLYTLYAIALKTNLQWPKGDVPEGCPRLQALINEDIQKAYESYQDYPFAKGVDQAEFTKMYTEIKTSNERFMASQANLGQWALALWYAGAGLDGSAAERVNFPEMTVFDETAYPYPPDDIALELHIPSHDYPVLVDREGKMYMYLEKSETYEPFTYEYDAFPMTASEKDAVSPEQEPKNPEVPTAPKPTPEPKPETEPETAPPPPQMPPEMPIAEMEQGPKPLDLDAFQTALTQKGFRNIQRPDKQTIQFNYPDARIGERVTLQDYADGTPRIFLHDAQNSQVGFEKVPAHVSSNMDYLAQWAMRWVWDQKQLDQYSREQSRNS